MNRQHVDCVQPVRGGNVCKRPCAVPPLQEGIDIPLASFRKIKHQILERGYKHVFTPTGVGGEETPYNTLGHCQQRRAFHFRKAPYFGIDFTLDTFRRLVKRHGCRGHGLGQCLLVGKAPHNHAPFVYNRVPLLVNGFHRVETA